MPNTPKWEEEFREKFPKIETYCEEHKGYCPGMTEEHVILFIQRIINAEVHKALGRVEIEDAISCDIKGLRTVDEVERVVMNNWNDTNREWRLKKEEILKDYSLEGK